MPDPALLLQRFGKSFTTELLLLVRNWGYALLHVAWAALLVALFARQDPRSAQALLETTLGRLAIGLISLAGLFLAGLSASRPQRVCLADLEDTFPTGFEVMLGRWLAGVLALCLLLVEPLAIAAVRGPLASLLSELPVFLGEAVLTIAFTGAAAWALVAWLRPGRWIYPLLAAGWLAFLLGPTLLTGLAPWTSLFNFMRQGISFYSELWGRLVYGEQPFWFNLFYAGLLLVALAVASLRVHLRRFHHSALWSVALLAVALATAGLGGLRYAAAVQSVQAAPQWNPAVDAPAAFTVEAYDITLDLSDPVLPWFRVELSARNTSTELLGELAFTLNPALVISDADGSVSREGALVRVRLSEPLAPGATIAIPLQYQGAPRIEILQEGVIEATDFIDPRGVRLTPAAAWYPIPAGNASVTGLHDAARLRLAITGADDLRFGANLPPVAENVFAGEKVQWVFLAGSPHLVLEQIGPHVLVTSQVELPQARRLLNTFTHSLETLARLFPDVPVRGMVLMVLGEESGLPEGTPPAGGSPVVVLPAYRLPPAMSQAQNVAQMHTIVEALTIDLWRLGGGALDARVGQMTGLQYAFDQGVTFLTRYVWESGDLATMQADFQRYADPAVDSVYQALLDVYARQGDAGLARALAQMRTRGEELRPLPYDVLPGWVRAATQAETP